MKSRIAQVCVLLIAVGWLAATSRTIAAEADTHEGLVASAGAGKLAMTGSDGKEHSYDIGAAVKIMVNGHMGKLEDLKVGSRIRVTTDKIGHALSVATVDSTKGVIGF
jgi:hypothetical protein